MQCFESLEKPWNFRIKDAFSRALKKVSMDKQIDPI